MTSPLLAGALLLALVPPGSTFAAGDEGPDPDAEADAAAFLDACRAALGAPADLARVENVRAHGRATWGGRDEADTPGLEKGWVTEIYAGLGRAVVITDFPAIGSFEEGCSDGVVWERTPLDLVIREGWDACEVIRRFGIAQNLDWRAMYAKARLVGSKLVGGHVCREVQLFPRMLVKADERMRALAPPPDVWLIDEETLLPRVVRARSVGLLNEPVELVIELDDWRLVDGIRYPHSVQLEVGPLKVAIQYESFEHDVELPPDFFALDDEVRAAVERLQDPDAAHEQREITIMNLQERHIASIRARCTLADMQKTLSVLLPEAMEHVVTSGATPAGPPLVRFHDAGPELDFEAAIPVAAPTRPKGRVTAETLPGGEAAVVWHVGPYHELARTHRRLEHYLEEQGLELRDAPWEEYWTDPGVEPDPSKWRTRVVWPVRPRGE